MNRKELDKLPLEQQINYINSELKKGISFNALCKKMGVPKSTIRSRLSRNNYFYNTELKQVHKNNTYVNNDYKSTQEKNITLKSTEKTSFEEVHQNKLYQSTPDIKDIKDIKKLIGVKENIIELAQLKDNIVEMLKDYNLNKNIIDIPELKIDSENFTGDIKAKTFKVYQSVLDDFIEFSEKNNYKMQDLISQAIYEFVNKYKR